MRKFTNVDLISLAFDVSRSEAKRLSQDTVLEVKDQTFKGWTEVWFGEQGWCRLRVGRRMKFFYIEGNRYGVI